MKQLEFKRTKGWGGKRRGAGRPNRSSTVNHMSRARVDFKKPLQITMKLTAGYATLRRKEFLQLFQNAIRKAKAFDLHVLHFSLLSNHIHLIVEAPDNTSLGKGMQSLAIRLAKAIKRKAPKAGSVFSGRYHLRVITSPTQMVNSLRYVLLNSCKHGKREPQFDTYSSAWQFPELWRLAWSWRIELETKYNDFKTEDIGLSAPRSWLAAQGWRNGLRKSA